MALLGGIRYENYPMRLVPPVNGKFLRNHLTFLSTVILLWFFGAPMSRALAQAAAAEKVIIILSPEFAELLGISSNEALKSFEYSILKDPIERERAQALFKKYPPMILHSNESKTLNYSESKFLNSGLQDIILSQRYYSRQSEDVFTKNILTPEEKLREQKIVLSHLPKQDDYLLKSNNPIIVLQLVHLNTVTSGSKPKSGNGQ